MVSNICLYFLPWGSKWYDLTHIFQMGWFNHQLELNHYTKGVGSLYIPLFTRFYHHPGWLFGFIPPTSQVIQGLPVDEQNLIFAGRSLESTERREPRIDRLPFAVRRVERLVFNDVIFSLPCVCVCDFWDSIDQDKWWGIMLHYVLYWDTYEAFQ